MSSRPVVFISAVSKELRSQRETVAKALRYIGCEPVIQDEFGTETGNIRQMLEQKINPCHALIQLVGRALGSVVKDAQHAHEAMSYTQYEAYYASEQGKRLWYILIADTWKLPYRSEGGEDLLEESTEDAEEQRTYWRKLKRSPHLYHIIDSQEKLELAVLKMLHDLDAFRTPCTHWLTEGEPASQPAASSASPDLATKADVRQLFDEYVQKLGPIRQETDPEKEEASEDELIAQLAAKQGKTPDELRRQLNQTAATIQADKQEPAIARAQAAFAQREYAEAEKLALQAAREAVKKGPKAHKKQIEALQLAGKSAREQIHYEDALQHFQSAAKLTDEKRDPVPWAKAQWWIALALGAKGDYRSAEAIYRKTVPIYEQHEGAKHPDTLKSRNNLAEALRAQGKHAEAEVEHRAVMAIMQRVQGAEHPDTLASRNNLANALQSQGKHAEAEVEHRAVLVIRERVLGAEHLDTLKSRNNLAAALQSQGKHAEAEAENRAVLAIRERVQGAEHPDVFTSCYNLALCLESQNQLPEALAIMQRAEAGRRKVLGAEHPDTKDAKRSLDRLQRKKREAQP